MVSSGWRVFYLDDIIGAGGIVGGSVLATITNIYYFLLLIIYYLLLLLLPYVLLLFTSKGLFLRNKS